MTTLIIKHHVLESDKENLRQHLEERGGKIKRFEFVQWIRNWLRDPAGCFWGRKVVIPKVGDICIARVDTCVEKDGCFVANGRIADTRCVVRGKALLGETVKVRVASVKGKEVQCEVAEDKAVISRQLDIRYKIYYYAGGVTGVLEKERWCDDVVGLVRVSPNEMLSTDVLAGFERIAIPKDMDCEFDAYPEAGKDDPSGYVLAMECENCDGQGDLTCKKCDGSGRYQPECRRCEGTGNWKHGGTCNACNGTGHLDSECNACGGKGELECWVCRGSGVRRVWIDYKTGELSVTGKNKECVSVSNDEVFLWRERDDARIQPVGNWREIERMVETALDRRHSATERAVRLKQDFAGIIKGLDEKILHNDTTQLPPVHAVMHMASLERRHGRVLYQLKEKGESAWKKTHNEPYPKGTLLRIEGLDLPQDMTISYEGYHAGSRELLVSFPQQLDVSKIRGLELEIRSAEMRPAEARQRDYLQRWLADAESAIFKAMVCGCEAEPARDVELFNKSIDKYKRQRLAVEYGVSDAPLFLLKGPPGTGKTTIIVEIIRQAIHKGQRVLLTSQTHQAVENVLEKLHALVDSGEDKSIRMVHYTAQEGKASDLAKRYRDGSGTAEIKAIREYVSEFSSKNEAVVAALSNPLFMKSLRKLCDEGAECAKKIADAQNAKRVDLAAIDREIADAIANADKEKSSLLEALDGTLGREISRNRQTLARKQKALNRENEMVAASNKRIAEKKKRIRGLTDGSLASKLRGLLSIVSENYNVNAVRDQLEAAKRENREAVLNRGFLSSEIIGLQKTLQESIAEYEGRRSAIEKASAERRASDMAKSEHRRARKSAEHDDAIGRLRKIHIQMIENLGNLLCETAGLGETSGASDWLEVCGRVEKKLERARRIQEFVAEWEKTITDKPEVVGKFLDSQSNVFLATCVGVGGWRSLMDGTYDRRFEDVNGIRPEKFFDLVIVDEAGHATCAETIIPLSMGRRAILIGDDKQLPPMEDDDLETESLFSKLWEDRGCNLPRVMLDTQFRMHPIIADFVSETFYNGELKNGITESDRAFQFSSFNRPVCLLSTSNQPNHYEKWKKPSFENPLEATYVKEILDALVEHCREHGAKEETVSVAVITPYAEQVSLIRQKVKPLIGSSGNVLISEDDIASVDKFQGGERDVVIASFVRSPKPNAYAPKLTFVQDLKRMNVAFSRPRKMLILVGDIDALSTGLGDEEGRKAFEAFHRVVNDKGLEVLAWERKAP